MASGVPANLVNELRSVESQIRTAFHGTRRDWGTSWSESRVIDNYGGEDERATARALDTEKCWEDLVDDPNWEHEPGIGGFNFLDAIGSAYYIAPAMIRCGRDGGGEFIGYALTIDSDYKRDWIKALDEARLRAIARFVRFMIAVHDAVGDDIYGESWKNAYDIYWRQWDSGASATPSVPAAPT